MRLRFENKIRVFFFLMSGSVFAQSDFLNLYAQINTVYGRHRAELDAEKLNSSDTSAVRAFMNSSRKFHDDSIFPFSKKVVNMTFPDINFSDAEGKTWALSDFTGKDVVVNYNYMYCPLCLDRIDSTEKRIRPGKAVMVVLFQECPRSGDFHTGSLCGSLSFTNKFALTQSRPIVLRSLCALLKAC